MVMELTHSYPCLSHLYYCNNGIKSIIKPYPGRDAKHAQDGAVASAPSSAAAKI
jgi:hypothetical protein